MSRTALYFFCFRSNLKKWEFLHVAKPLHFVVVVQILPAWPFDDRNPKLLMLFLPHHAFSFIITVPVIITGMAADVHAQKIGACLLFAGGVSALILSFTRTCDRRDPCQAWQEVCMCVHTYMCMYEQLFKAGLMSVSSSVKACRNEV